MACWFKLRSILLVGCAGVNPHTWSYDFAETYVFGKQSPGPGHCDPLFEEAPLLRKLRGNFAEFLRESCLATLGILYLPTCVGFGYRYPLVEGHSSFSWEYGIGYFSAVAPGTRTLARGISSTPSYPEKARLEKPPTDALRPIIPDNAYILCLTAAAGTELADAYSSDTIIASSPRKEVHDELLALLGVGLEVQF
ncbi:hypothetical protein IEQ34_017835 [Dendrobium chrysotoxum]|uniref:Uncharacterized protein n=1 Tax=Dendrobium chrysotoxum TaxID=161865 RepID=A0AAV7GAR4_DENCH|nr:hypothetical protein IEQ34_017835 [Dendrobium chrysotoxum]